MLYFEKEVRSRGGLFCCAVHSSLWIGGAVATMESRARMCTVVTRLGCTAGDKMAGDVGTGFLTQWPLEEGRQSPGSPWPFPLVFALHSQRLWPGPCQERGR